MNAKRSTTTEPDFARFYGHDFYKKRIDKSYKSASKYADLLSPLLKPHSVVDVGCGRGSWLKAFKEHGASKLTGYDGWWNSQENMIDQSIVFYGVDLNGPIHSLDSERYDLAMSLEVAEHLEPASAQAFIGSLTGLSDTVLFGAAYTKQGGTNHINERPHTYWAKLFSLVDYVPYDLFRPIVWGDKDIPFWYQQNTFLYVRNNTPASRLLLSAGHVPMQNILFMDCIHPTLYEWHTREIETALLVRELATRMIPESVRRIVKRKRAQLS